MTKFVSFLVFVVCAFMAYSMVNTIQMEHVAISMKEAFQVCMVGFVGMISFIVMITGK